MTLKMNSHGCTTLICNTGKGANIDMSCPNLNGRESEDGKVSNRTDEYKSKEQDDAYNIYNQPAETVKENSLVKQSKSSSPSWGTNREDGENTTFIDSNENDERGGKRSNLSNGETGEEEVKLEGDDDTDGLPIDRGWAWFVLAGCFLNVLLFVGYIKSLSILFVEYLRLFEASATATTLIMGVLAGVYSLSGPFTMHFVLERLDVRKTALLGGTICTVAMVTGVFAPNIIFLICVHCVLSGIGQSMLFGPGLVIVGRYFKKRRGMAMAIAMSATSLASGVFPVITRFILDEYGIRGTMLIFTGLTMNMFVAGSLYRPLTFYKRRNKPKINITSCANQVAGSLSVDGNSENLRITQTASKKDSFVTGNNLELNGETPLSSSLPCYKDSFLSSLNQLQVPRMRTYSDCTREPQTKHISQSEKILYASNPDILSVSILDLTSVQTVTQKGEGDIDIVNQSARIKKCHCSILDFSLFKRPMFQLMTFCAPFGILVNIIPNYLPALANEKGIPKTDAALLLLIMGTLDFFSRLCLGALVDLKILKVSKIVAIGLICSGTMAQFTSFYNTYPLMVMFAVINGIVGSTYHSLMPVLLVDFMGLDYMGKSLGFTTMFHGMAVAFTHPIIGGIKDLSGSFTYGYSYLGVGAYIAAFLLLIGEPLCRRRDMAMSQLRDEHDESKKQLQEC